MITNTEKVEIPPGKLEALILLEKLYEDAMIFHLSDEHDEAIKVCTFIITTTEKIESETVRRNCFCPILSPYRCFHCLRELSFVIRAVAKVHKGNFESALVDVSKTYKRALRDNILQTLKKKIMKKINYIL